MLVLRIKVGESFYIGDETIITVIDKWPGEAVLQLETDDSITIDDNHRTNSPAINLTPKCQT